MMHGLFAVGSAAAGGDDMVRQVEFADFFFLNAAQVQVAAFFEQMLQRALSIDLDKHIGIDKAEGQIFCQDDANGTFARAGHANQGDVAAHDARGKGGLVIQKPQCGVQGQGLFSVSLKCLSKNSQSAGERS